MPYAKAKKTIKQGCQTFLASLVSSSEESVELASILVVLKFPDVLTEKLFGIPPPREIEFSIDVASGTETISKVPYQIVLAESKELKAYF